MKKKDENEWGFATKLLAYTFFVGLIIGNIVAIGIAFVPSSIIGASLSQKLLLLAMVASIDCALKVAFSDSSDDKNEDKVIRLVGDKDSFLEAKRKIEVRNKQKELKKRIDNNSSNNVNKSHNDFIDGQINLFENYENVYEFKDEKVKVKTLKK